MQTKQRVIDYREERRKRTTTTACLNDGAKVHAHKSRERTKSNASVIEERDEERISRDEIACHLNNDKSAHLSHDIASRKEENGHIESGPLPRYFLYWIAQVPL